MTDEIRYGSKLRFLLDEGLCDQVLFGSVDWSGWRDIGWMVVGRDTGDLVDFGTVFCEGHGS